MNPRSRILIADDDPTVVMLMRASLENAGYEVVVARDGIEALDKFDESRCDLVMLDVDMPGKDGMEVCAMLRAKAAPTLPIVMVTGLDDVDSVEAAYRSGATDFIVKPIHWPLIPHRIGFQLRAAKTLSELREAKQFSDSVSAELASTLEAIPDLLFEVDGQGRYLKVHRHRTDLLWSSPAVVIGQRMVDCLPAEAAGVCMAALREAEVSGVSRGRQYALKLGNELRWFELSVSRKCDVDPAHSDFIVIARDITTLKQQQHQLEHFAHFDALTGLPNRVLLSDRLQQAMLMARRHHHMLAVVYLDLDEFKLVNDRFGHDTGDRLLIALAERMQQVLRQGDTLARIGGDEFVLVLTDLADTHEYQPIIERLLLAAHAPVDLGAQRIQVSASVGVTHYPNDAGEPEMLIRHADQAMYQAKLAGKNRSQCFDVAQDAALKLKFENIERFRSALHDGEFRLFYQPKVDLDRGRVIGVEALIRWQHPERGLLSPAAFLPLLDDHPFSSEVGNWVIDTALAQLTAWRALGLDLSISVNIGGMQLQQSDFVARLVQSLARHPGLPRRALQLELLETTALKDLARVREVMQACHDIGVSFALDDFGTGYSSLAYLKHLPVDTLKIDQGFVREILHDPSDRAIVKGVISMAATLGREVVAEGVETQAHGQLLCELGCTTVQGYGIAKPMPADAMPDWIAAWQAQPTWLA